MESPETHPSIIELDISPTNTSFIMDSTIQQRVGLDEATVEAYAELYHEGRDLGRITVFADPATGTCILADGWHRVFAARHAMRMTLPAEVHQGGSREALLYATSANLHGRPLSNQDKRKRVMTMLADEEWSQWSDNAIAKHCGVAHSFVARVRDSLLDSESSETEASATVRTYKDRYGNIHTMDTTAIGRKAAPIPCQRCGRPLTDPDSQAAGVGPICAACRTTPQAPSRAPASPILPGESEPVLDEEPPAEPLTEEEREDQRRDMDLAAARDFLKELADEYGYDLLWREVVLPVFPQEYWTPPTPPEQTDASQSVGMKQCKYGHAPYLAEKRECPTCVNNRQRNKRQRAKKAAAAQ
jgi:hypothetical protein